MGKNKSIGFDAGTSKVEVAVNDGASTTFTERVDVRTRKDGKWTIQDITDVRRAILLLTEQAGRSEDLTTINSIGLCATTTSLLAVGEDGEPQSNVFMWCSTADEGATNPDNTNRGSRMMAALDRDFPSVVRRARYIVDVADYLRHWMSGQLAVNKSTLAAKFAWTARNGFDLRGLEGRGMSELLTKLPRRPVAVGETVGVLRRGALLDLGLRRNTPVVNSAYDTPASIPGAGISEPGSELLMSVGTSLGVYMIPNAQKASINNWPFRSDLIPGPWKTLFGGFEAGAQSIRILNDRVLLSCQAADKYGWLENEICTAEAACDAGVFALPFGGVHVRAPIHRPLRSFVGLGDELVPNDLHSLVAMRRGIAYFAAYCIDDLRSRGVSISAIHLVGGGSRSRSFCQLICDVCDLPVVNFGSSAAAVGAAIIARMALSPAEYHNSVTHLRQSRPRYQPLAGRRTLYDQGFLVFLRHLKSALVD